MVYLYITVFSLSLSSLWLGMLCRERSHSSFTRGHGPQWRWGWGSPGRRESISSSNTWLEGSLLDWSIARLCKSCAPGASEDQLPSIGATIWGIVNEAIICFLLEDKINALFAPVSAEAGGTTNLERRHTIFIVGQIYCYARFCVTQSVSPKVSESPSGPLVDYFLVLTDVACGDQLCGLLPGVDRWSSLYDPRVIGPCHHEL